MSADSPQGNNSRLAPCPFCKEVPETCVVFGMDGVAHSTSGSCTLRSKIIDRIEWDKLKPAISRIEVLEGALRDAMEFTGPCYCNRKIEYKCPICDLRKRVAALSFPPESTGGEK